LTVGVRPRTIYKNVWCPLLARRTLPFAGSTEVQAQNFFSNI